MEWGLYALIVGILALLVCVFSQLIGIQWRLNRYLKTSIDRKRLESLYEKLLTKYKVHLNFFFFECIFFWSLIIDILISLADSHYLRAGSFKSGNLVSDGVT